MNSSALNIGQDLADIAGGGTTVTKIQTCTVLACSSVRAGLRALGEVQLSGSSTPTFASTSNTPPALGVSSQSVTATVSTNQFVVLVISTASQAQAITIQSVTDSLGFTYTQRVSVLFVGSSVLDIWTGFLVPPPTASGAVDNAVAGASGLLSVLVLFSEIALLMVTVEMIRILFGGDVLALSPVLTFGVGLLIIVIFAVTVLAVMGSFDPIFRAQGN